MNAKPYRMNLKYAKVIEVELIKIRFIRWVKNTKWVSSISNYFGSKLKKLKVFVNYTKRNDIMKKNSIFHFIL